MVMTNKKKILLIATTIAVAVGGFAITQWWVKSVYTYKGYKDKDMINVVEDDSTEINSNEIP
jgi:multidrug resistance efflux pump